MNLLFFTFFSTKYAHEMQGFFDWKWNHHCRRQLICRSDLEKLFCDKTIQWGCKNRVRTLLYSQVFRKDAITNVQVKPNSDIDLDILMVLSSFRSSSSGADSLPYAALLIVLSLSSSVILLSVLLCCSKLA